MSTPSEQAREEAQRRVQANIDRQRDEEAQARRIGQEVAKNLRARCAVEWRGPAEEAPGFQYELDANDDAIDRASELGHKPGSPSVGRDALDPRYGGSE
jgi:hypothetical protein